MLAVGPERGLESPPGLGKPRLSKDAAGDVFCNWTRRTQPSSTAPRRKPCGTSEPPHRLPEQPTEFPERIFEAPMRPPAEWVKTNGLSSSVDGRNKRTSPSGPRLISASQVQPLSTRGISPRSASWLFLSAPAKPPIVTNDAAHIVRQHDAQQHREIPIESLRELAA